MFAAGDKLSKGEQCATLPVSPPPPPPPHYQPRRASISGQTKFLLVLMLLLTISFISNEEYGGFIDVTSYNGTSRGQDSGYPRPVARTGGASASRCNDVLDIPKVALLFLTKEPNIYHEKTWKRWFQSASNKIPASKVYDTFCHPLNNNKYYPSSPRLFSEIKDTCTTTTTTTTTTTAAPTANRRNLRKHNKKSNNDPILQQHLFSAYVHIPAGHQEEEDYPSSSFSFPTSSIFYRHVVSHRLPSTGWGGFSIVTATRSLLWEAYQDPHNQDFVLLSESDIPMYDPLTFYHQLTEETRSRINACPHHADPGSTMVNRWTDAMETEHMKKGNWRKSGQFWSLKREHVKMILDDEEVIGSFEKFCNGWMADEIVITVDEENGTRGLRGGGEEEEDGGLYKVDDGMVDSDGIPKPAAAQQQNQQTKKKIKKQVSWRNCIPDEHYFPTLFSVMGKEEEANCGSWGVVYADWSRGGSHPRAYTSSEATTSTMEANRQSPDKCPAAQAQQCAKRMFIDIGSLMEEELPDVCLRRGEEEEAEGCGLPLPVGCHLTNRKWPEETSDAVYNMFVNNTELGLLAHL